MQTPHTTLYDELWARLQAFISSKRYKSARLDDFRHRWWSNAAIPQATNYAPLPRHIIIVLRPLIRLARH